MKTIKFLVSTFLIFTLFCCTNDETRDEFAGGVPTLISGNVKDYHRNTNISNFEIKLIKYWNCGVSGNLTPLTCEKEIAKVITDTNGNYTLHFDYNLRSDENYRIILNQTDTNIYYTEYVAGNGSFYTNFEISNLIKGQTNVININAWKPIRLKFNLSVLNNHTPPLITSVEYNGKYDFGSEFTYDAFRTFEIRTRPNSDIKIKFGYIVNYNTSNPTYRNAPPIDYHTNTNDITELNYTVNCNDF